MKVGILGGTFDPIHRGHIAIARAAKEQLGLDMVRIMPARIPPHKRGTDITDDVHRLMMIALALPVGDGIELDLTEFERETVSYTSDTLSILRERHPDDEIYYIIGEDSLRDFPTWHEPATIASLAKIPVAVRSHDAAHFQELLTERNRQYNGAFLALSVPYDETSSTEIRREICHRSTPHPALTLREADYIRRFGLYGCKPEALTKEALDRYEQFLKMLTGTISTHRLNHSKGVAFMAANLMAAWAEDEKRTPRETRKLVRKALLAGILHDCAKNMSPEEMLAYLRKHRYPISEELPDFPGIVHGPAGRVLARDHYGVRDAEILRAIGNHCNGSEEMPAHPVELAVFIADFTEPFRDHIPTPPLPVIRDEALRNGAKAAEMCSAATIYYLNDIGYPVSREGLRIYEAIKEYNKQQKDFPERKGR